VRIPGLALEYAPNRLIAVDVQGYLAHKKPTFPRNLQKAYASGPMVALGGVAVSYERGTPVCAKSLDSGLRSGVDLVDGGALERETEFFVDKLLVRIHLIIEMILVDRPCAMGV